MSERPAEVGSQYALNLPADTLRTTFDVVDPMFEGPQKAQVSSRFLVRRVRGGLATSVN